MKTFMYKIQFELHKRSYQLRQVLTATYKGLVRVGKWSCYGDVIKNQKEYLSRNFKNVEQAFMYSLKSFKCWRVLEQD